MRTAAWTLAALLCALPVLAQEAKSTTAPKLQQVQEVERGFWMRANMGFSMSVVDMFGAGTSADTRSSTLWPPGPVLQLEFGFDLGQVASIHLGLQGQQIVGVRDMGATRADVSNDAAMMAILLGGRLNLVTSKRLAWYFKANVGYMFTAPELAEFSAGLLVGGGTGIESATMLRHFFVGLELSGSYDLANGGVLVALTPSLKYTF